MKSQQPNSRLCFVCGVENPIGLALKFYQTGPGEVTAECVLGDEYQGYPGIVHGGIVAAMLDEITARTLMGGEPTRFMYTAKMEVRYRNHVPIGEKLRLVGKALKANKRATAATGAIYGPDGKLLAEAEALLVDVPDEVIQSVDMEALGWKVYADENGS